MGIYVCNRPPVIEMHSDTYNHTKLLAAGGCKVGALDMYGVNVKHSGPPYPEAREGDLRLVEAEDIDPHGVYRCEAMVMPVPGGVSPQPGEYADNYLYCNIQGAHVTGEQLRALIAHPVNEALSGALHQVTLTKANFGQVTVAAGAEVPEFYPLTIHKVLSLIHI